MTSIEVRGFHRRWLAMVGDEAIGLIFDNRSKPWINPTRPVSPFAPAHVDDVRMRKLTPRRRAYIRAVCRFTCVIWGARLDSAHGGGPAQLPVAPGRYRHLADVAQRRHQRAEVLRYHASTRRADGTNATRSGCSVCRWCSAAGGRAPDRRLQQSSSTRRRCRSAYATDRERAKWSCLRSATSTAGA